ncbi:MAG TPA: hypothetical protein VFR84_13370 [Candidatus Angelobacter sp.]|nr:hypothetical protein [Candidatus Angelobacter sp.]
MDIRGLLLVNTGNLREEDSAFLVSGPLGLLDIAGKSALERASERLLAYGIAPVTAIVESTAFPLSGGFTLSSGLNCVSSTPERFWRAAENAFNDMAQNGAELVVLVRLGAYAEIDFEKLVQVHLDRGSRVSQVSHDGQKLDIFCISASRRNDAASLFRSQLSRCRSECPQVEYTGNYVNALAVPRDLRQFAIDILTRQTQTCPAGDEAKPGVWMSGKAILEKGARVLAPAYIGADARVRTGAVITRCSSVEHHAEVDCGSVVENSSVLPYCYVGAGLDLAHSVVGMRQVANLRRDVTVEVPDPKLIDLISATSGKNFLHSAADLLTYLPRAAMQGIFSGGKQPQPDLSDALRKSSPALDGAAGYETPACDSDAAQKFPNMIVARRYGHQ